MKLLVFGAINGDYKAFAKRLRKVNKKNGPFDVCICVGKFISDSTDAQWPDGSDVAVDTYIMTASARPSSLPNTIHCLSGSGVVSTTGGLRIAYGTDENAPTDDQKSDNIDIALVTSSHATWWQALTPQYCFMGDASEHTEVVVGGTRVIVLTSLKKPADSDGKPLKSLYACTMTAGATNNNNEEPPLKKSRTNTDGDDERFSGFAPPTISSRWSMDGMPPPPPSSSPSARKLPDGYVCRRCHIPGHHIHDCQQERKVPDDYVCKRCNQRGHHVRDCEYTLTEEQRALGQRRDCWFCLGTDAAETHLILSIGTDAYLALAKGVLVPEHVLVVPIQHVTHSMQLTLPAMKEIAKCKQSLRAYFESKSKVVVFFERFIPTSAGKQYHMSIEAVPLDASVAADMAVESAIQKRGTEQGWEFRMLRSGESLREAVAEQPYIYIEVGASALVHIVTDRPSRAYFEFVRGVLAELIGHPERRDWKYCSVSKHIELQLTDRFRQGYSEKYDFAADAADDA